MFTAILYALAGLGLLASSMRDRAKTVVALRKAWTAFEGILPQFLGIIVLVSLLLAYVDADTIAGLLGRASGWRGVLLAATIGAITLIPGFVAFPTAALIMRNGAGTMQVAAFISSLMMVGVVTMPVEMKYFGRKLTFRRNGLAFLVSLLIAWVVGMVAG